MTELGNLTEMERRLFEEAASIDSEILEMYSKNRRLPDPSFYALLAAYSVLICFGVCGNVLVIWVVLRKPAMRTVRNLFILNLAVGDLLLCLVVVPLTLMEIHTRFWPLGDNVFACKIIGTCQATSIFVSSFSITAIALDRYQLIVNPTRDSLHKVGALLALAMIWIMSFILAGPLYVTKRLVFPENITQIQDSLQLEVLAYCIEDWPIDEGRGIYSGVCFILQYLLPIVTVSIAYSQICRKLQYRHVAARASTSRRRSRDERRRRTNSLLVAITVLYCFSWLPLNVFNTVQDFQNLFGDDHNTMVIVWTICHMVGMSSACSNPLLYGWLNDNFRKEFKEILSMACPCSGSNRPRWMQSFRSSFSKNKSKNQSTSSGEKISMKAKEPLEEDGSVYVDEIKSTTGDEKGRRGLERINETMTTSLETCDYGGEITDVPADL